MGINDSMYYERVRNHADRMEAKAEKLQRHLDQAIELLKEADDHLDRDFAWEASDRYEIKIHEFFAQADPKYVEPDWMRDRKKLYASKDAADKKK